MEAIKITAPFDDQVLAEYPLANSQQVEAMLQRASTAATRHPLRKTERVRILEATRTRLAMDREALALQAAREGGKPLADSLVEVDRGLQGIEVALQTLATLHGEEIPMGHTVSSQNRIAFTRREPIGPVLAISAFNHPFNLIVHQVIPAIATGCPVIIKPSLETPMSCYSIVEALYKAGLPEDWCQVALCRNDVAEALVADSRIRFFSFIGSAQVGWHLRSKLAPGVHCALEHGGAAPVIAMDDTDWDDILPLLAKGGLYHAGQVCVSVQRLFVPRGQGADIGQRLRGLIQDWQTGDPTDPNTQVGPLIRQRELERVDAWVQEATSSATLLAGGRTLDGQCYQPTLLLNPSDQAMVSVNEIFGPVINIYEYDSLDEAVQRANAVPYVFQAAVFGQRIDPLLRLVRDMDAATVLVNDHTAFRVDWMPFGGRRQSGMGVGGIPYTMRDLTPEKLVVIRTPYAE